MITDSIYIVLQSPHDDIYQKYARFADGVSKKELIKGIPVGDLLVRGGANGFSLSVWKGDVRLYMTDRVNDNLVNTSLAGQGMGYLLQIGPKWIVTHFDPSSMERFVHDIFQLFEEFGFQAPEQYPARLNRLDIALDVLGCPVSEFSMDEWNTCWVGYASKKDFHISAQTRQMSGLSIGSRQGATRLTVYDKTQQSLIDNDFWFWFSVWEPRILEIPFEERPRLNVTRFEWSTRPYTAKFESLQYLTDLSEQSLKELANYVSLKWGRLCIPDETDTNQSRWELAPLWKEIRRVLVDEWDLHLHSDARREYEMRPDLNMAYLQSLAGWIGGGMARLGIQHKGAKPESVDELLEYLGNAGLSISRKAQSKWDVMQRLNSNLYDGADDKR